MLLMYLFVFIVLVTRVHLTTFIVFSNRISVSPQVYAYGVLLYEIFEPAVTPYADLEAHTILETLQRNEKVGWHTMKENRDRLGLFTI